MRGILLTVLALLCLGAGGTAAAGEGGPMNNARLDALIRQIDGIDGAIEGEAGAWRFRYKGFLVFVFTDERADRMRVMTPVAEAEGLSKEDLYRLLQADFDTALDARYALAQGTLWSAFIHPLSPLGEAEFWSGFQQTVTLAGAYGTTYSSGGLRFGGGDEAPTNDKPVQ